MKKYDIRHESESKCYYPLISVVMPNYNGEKFVESAIDSVLCQTYRNLELIIVDDCSTDKSLRLIENKAIHDERIKVLVLPDNKGVANARNTGITEATGEYIALLDNDDLWAEDKLERQIAVSNKGADLVYCSYDFIDENNNIIRKPFIVPQTTDFRHMLSKSVISCSTAFIRSELLKDHPFNTEFYHEDYVLWMELLRLPITAKGDQKVLTHYRQSAGSRSNNKGNAARERWRTYREALRLSLPTSICSFLAYSVNGAIKYYF